MVTEKPVKAWCFGTGFLSLLLMRNKVLRCYELAVVLSAPPEWQVDDFAGSGDLIQCPKSGKDDSPLL